MEMEQIFLGVLKLHNTVEIVPHATEKIDLLIYKRLWFISQPVF